MANNDEPTIQDVLDALTTVVERIAGMEQRLSTEIARADRKIDGLASRLSTMKDELSAEIADACDMTKARLDRAGVAAE